MSKKNRGKNRVQEIKTAAVPSPANAPAAGKPKDAKDEDLKREFKNLAMTIGFILLLLAAIYYLDRENHILDRWTEWIFGLF